jgi:hypothetical protein
MILSLSKGLTTVREVAPAAPPATKYDAISGIQNVCLCPFTAAMPLDIFGCEDCDDCVDVMTAGAKSA